MRIVPAGVRSPAQQMMLAIGIPIDRNVVRRILAARYEPTPESSGPAWLTVVGHAKDSHPNRPAAKTNRAACA